MQTLLFSRKVREIIIEESHRAHVGHIGSALSIVEILSVLFNDVMHLSRDPEKCSDSFILSKGHAALALYAALSLKGLIPEDELRTYCSDGTMLGVHPEHWLDAIEFSTGSLGYGLSYGIGVALAAGLKNKSKRVYVLVSDAECNEGSLWEAVMFAGHHKLSNLVAIVDDNGQQAMGKTTDILNLKPLSEKWEMFGWNAHEVDGHNIEQLRQAFNSLDTQNGSPHVIVANTVAGKGVSFMEGQVKWHYFPLNEREYEDACKEIRETP